MKKFSSFIVIGLLLVLAGASFFVYRSKSKPGSVEDEARNFSFKDTAAITKIFIADKEGQQSLLERTKNGWVVNGKYNCRTDAILNLMEVIKLVEVKMPVPKAAKEHVLKFMSYTAVKVEIYAGDELVKQYYVGHETEDAEGSYMVLTNLETGKNYDEPYACFIPGFVGFLQPRYIANENEWRDRLVLNYIPPKMREVKVQHNDMPADSSFNIVLLNANSFKLMDQKGAPIAFDEAKLRQYLVYYQNISYEALITGKNKKLQDSLSAQKPFCVISVSTTDFKTDEFRFYRKQFAGDINPEHGVKYEYDPDRLYMSFNNGKEWALVQYFVFGKLLVTRNYFFPASTVKK
jgi:hypothetical protein